MSLVKSVDLYKLPEREAFIHSMIAKLKEFLFEVVTAFCVSLVQGKTTDFHVVGGVIREV